jgi:isopenicillin N synthase-like dioxygenase
MKKYVAIVFLFVIWASNAPSDCICNITSQLQQQHYAIVSFDMEQKELDDAIVAFKQFLNLPDKLKNIIDLKLIPTHRRSDMGYKERKKKNGDGDTKVFFHYHPALTYKFKDLMKKEPVVANFFKKADKIWRKAYDTVYKITKGLEDLYPNANKSIFDTGDQPVHITLRFLSYDIPESKEKMARSHYDVGCCTLAIAESEPGLRIGKNEKNLKPVNHKDKEAIFFLSKNMESMMGKNSGFVPAWHDVVHPNTSNIKKRLALVAFVETTDGDGGTMEENHTVIK